MILDDFDQMRMFKYYFPDYNLDYILKHKAKNNIFSQKSLENRKMQEDKLKSLLTKIAQLRRPSFSAKRYSKKELLEQIKY